jgi:hypothetical protein
MESPTIKFGFRGEGIEYTLHGRTVSIEFTWCKGDRIYTDSIKKWDKNDETISAADKALILKDTIAFMRKSKLWIPWGKPIAVINRDDPDRDLWEGVCDAERKSLKRVEYTSDEEKTAFAREMYLKVLKAGKKLVINGREMRTEQEVDEFLRRTNPRG